MKDFFKLKENKTDVKTEVLAGLTTFMTMAYILAVNPSILGATGMPTGELFTATAIAAIVGTTAMALLANLPFALAPGMGLNAYMAFTVVLGYGYSWQLALFAVFLEGLLFILLSVVNVREAILNAIPKNLKYGISAGIGLFIAFVGLQNAGVVVQNSSTGVTLGEMTAAGPCLAVVGVLIIAVLHHRKVKGSLLIGILATWILGIAAELIGWYQVDSLLPSGIVSLPDWIGTIGGACFNMEAVQGGLAGGDFILNLIVVMLSFMFVDIFDTVGTLIGVASKADMLDENGQVPKAKQALLSDAIATSVGAVCGTSTTTTFVESAAGVAQGGRTGLTSLTVAGLFVLALFFSPIFLAIPSFATAPALIFVGFLMIESLFKVDYQDAPEAIPAFLATIMMPFAYSISEGIAFGIVSYVLINVCCGRRKNVSIIMWVLAILFLAYYIFVK
ncbi:MAG: NCS2 family permease [Lachnospiraceae bacterium]|jgi:AGZA family xanthine/uracil permease-like MFS transporter|nr:NCS2 family permease [Lachnospiraceae bacterium]